MNIVSDVSHEVCHCGALVIASDIRVHVLPSPLDPVVVGAIRRKEVENDSVSLRRLQTRLNQRGAVNREVIQNHVDLSRSRVALHQFPQQEDKQHRVFAITCDIG